MKEPIVIDQKETQEELNEKITRIAEDADFAKLLFATKVKNAEGFLMSIHILKGERIEHSFQYSNFPNRDWGNCLIAMALESKKSESSHTQKDRA